MIEWSQLKSKLWEMNVSHLTYNVFTIQTMHPNPLLTELFGFLCTFDMLWSSFDLDPDVMSSFKFDMRFKIWHEIWICHTVSFYLLTIKCKDISSIILHFVKTWPKITLKNVIRVINKMELFMKVFIINVSSMHGSSIRHELLMEHPKDMD